MRVWENIFCAFWSILEFIRVTLGVKWRHQLPSVVITWKTYKWQHWFRKGSIFVYIKIWSFELKEIFYSWNSIKNLVFWIVKYFIYYFWKPVNLEEMVTAQHNDHDPQADVVFVIEATSMNGTFINELKSSYILPILEWVFHNYYCKNIVYIVT